jgi:hypothetical protein
MMDRNAQIVSLREQGFGPREIATELGISPNVVAGVLRRNAPDLVTPAGCVRTLESRCAELNAKMDAVLAETAGLDQALRIAGSNKWPITAWGAKSMAIGQRREKTA